MVNEELIENIKTRFQQGERATEIREALLNEGWSDGDISAAFSHIRHEALLHIPIYAKIHNWMSSVDKKTAELPTRTIVQIFIGIALIFIGTVAALYYFLDPMGVRMSERDSVREESAIELRLALEKYYKENNKTYPSSTKQLVPKYLTTDLVDPKTGAAYEYRILNGMHYEFCIQFEIQVVRCVTSDNSSSIPTTSQEQIVTPLVQVQYAINGQIYYDVDKNGDRNDAEDVPTQVPVKITDATGAVLCETKTDSSGIFNCNVSGKGQYIVTLTVPSGYASAMGNPIQVNLPGTSSQVPNVETLFIGLVK
jgi:hypothetical protein